MNSLSIDSANTRQINEPNVARNRCPFLKLISKIWKAVKKIFKAIKNTLCPSPYNLSKKDLEHLQAAKQRIRPASQPSSPRTSLSKHNVEVKKTEESESKHQEESKAVDDPVYREFLDQAMKFIDLALEATYDQKIEPLVPKVQKQIDNLDGYLKFGADVAISVASGVYRPLVEKLEQFNVAEKLAPELLHFMHGLLKNKDDVNQDAFCKRLKENLRDIDDVEAKAAIKECRKWLFETDQAKPLLKSESFIKKSVLEKALKEAVLLLVENRIAEFNEKMHLHLNGDLSGIIKKMVMNNGHKLGEIVLNRLIEVVDQAPFTETFNEIIALLADHSGAVVRAENAREKAIGEEKSRLEKYDRAVKDSVRKNVKEEEVRQDFILLRKDYIEKAKELWIEEAGIQAEQKGREEARLEFQRMKKENPESPELEAGLEKWVAGKARDAREKARFKAREEVDNLGGGNEVSELETKMRDLWLQKVGERAAREKYKEILVKGEPLCHPCIDDLELVRDKKEKKSSNGVAIILDIFDQAFKPEDIGEKHLFDDSANRLMQLLFPPVTVVNSKGESHQVDGLLYLLDQIEWRSELKDIYKEAAFICREIGATAEQKRAIAMIESNQSRIEQCVLRWTRNEIKSTISDSVSALFQKFVVPSQIDEMMAFDLLPSVQDVIVGSLAKSLISEKVSTYSPMLACVIDSKDVDKEEKRETLVKAIVLKIKENLNSYEIEDDRLEELVEREVRELEEILEDFLSQRESTDDEDREAVIRSALEDIFKKQYHGNNARYGDLVVNAAFKLGRLNSTAEYFADWFKGMLSREISSATHEMQESPRYLLRKAARKIRSSYETKEAVRDLIYKPSEMIAAEDRQAKLDAEMKKTAEIAHDFLFYLSRQQPWYARKAIRWVIGSNPTHLEEVINRIYRKMFGSALYTQNLVVRMQERIAEALQKGGEALASAPRKIPVVDHVPSIISSFMYS